DQLAREVVAPGTSGAEAIRDRFGDAVFVGAELDRAALGRIVFGDPAARADLNAIVHPRVRARAAQQEAVAHRADPEGVVVHDIPLLVEAGLHTGFDVVLVVHAPPEVRLARLVEGRLLTEADARARMSAQA